MTAADPGDAEVLAKLSPVQVIVLCMTAKGLSCKEIGAKLHRSPDTIADHRKAIYLKLDVCSAPEAAVIAAKAGLV